MSDKFMQNLRPPTVAKKVIDLCNVILNLTRVLLLIVLVGYCAIGAYVFQILEGPHEIARNANTKLLEDIFRDKLKYMCHQPSLNISGIFAEMEIPAITLNRDYGSPSVTRWDFYGAFFFASTVVSTIGFGNLAPQTVGGQIFCVCFAIVGIPLCIMTLSRIGEWFLITRNWLSGCTSSKSGTIVIKLLLILFWPVVLLIIPAAIYQKTECGWSFSEALYFDFITLSTIGFGDYIASGSCIYDAKWEAVHKCAFFVWIVFGLSFVAEMINEIHHLIAKLESYLRQKLRRKGTVEPEAEE